MASRYVGRLARSLALVGIVAFAGIGLSAPRDSSFTPVALASVSQANGNDNNDDRSNDNSEERKLEGQVLEIYPDLSPPEVLIGTLGENVWARVYNEQLPRNGVKVGDYIRLQGEYGANNIFDAYQIDRD